MKSNAMELEHDSQMLTRKIFEQPLQCDAQGESKWGHSKVRRRLFGAADPTTPSVSEFLEQQLAVLADRSSREWNFDFISGTPMAGERYMWEPMNMADSPIVYQTVGRFRSEDCVETQDNCAANVIQESEQGSISQDSNNSLSKMADDEGKKEITLCGTSQDSSESLSQITEKVLVQTTIKGFLKVQKLRCSKRLRMRRRKTLVPRRASRFAKYSISCKGTTKAM